MRARAATQSATQLTDQVTREVTREVLRLLCVLHGEMKRQEMQAVLGLKHEDHFRNANLVPSLKAGVVEMTIPDKPRSSRQRYRLTQAGIEYQKKMKEEK